MKYTLIFALCRLPFLAPVKGMYIQTIKIFLLQNFR